MTDTFKDIEKLEADLWAAAGNLRANSKLTSSDYFMPVLGVIFLRHAANRFEAATHQIEADQAAGRMPRRHLLLADYLRRRALRLPEAARYDWIMQQAATSGSDLPRLVTDCSTITRYRRTAGHPAEHHWGVSGSLLHGARTTSPSASQPACHDHSGRYDSR